MNYKTSSLTPYQRSIICDKETEKAFSGEYYEKNIAGSYLCRQCGLALFRANTQFISHCGWASFDQEIFGTVRYQSDEDGRRTEILCNRCNGHLGHVFKSEGLTSFNIRHCVNSASLDFVQNLEVLDTEEAILAAGCFWGVEYYFKKLSSVLKVEVGYSGGSKPNPSYEEVSAGNTGHFESIRIIFDPSKISYQAIIKYFFEIHDPTQDDGQGPDLGTQYLSVCFYYNDQQKQTILLLKKQLIQKGYDVQTQVLPICIFWPAEDYHQNYYQKTGKEPYCHSYVKKFDDYI